MRASYFIALCISLTATQLAAEASSFLPGGPEPFAVGHVQRLGDAGIEVKTLSVDPPIFHLPGFLTEKEADATVKKLNKHDGWSNSLIKAAGPLAAIQKLDIARQKGKGQLTKNISDILETVIERQVKATLQQILPTNDLDGSGKLDKNEMELFFRATFEIQHYDHAHFAEFVLGKKATQDQHLPIPQIIETNLVSYMAKLGNARRNTAIRDSNTQWVQLKGSFGQTLLARFAAITGVDVAVLAQSNEHLQAVKYSEGGHYSCHLDWGGDLQQEEQDIDDLNGGESGQRLLTVGMFLSDVQEGGHTVFPGVVGGNSSWTARQWQQFNVKTCPTLCKGAPSNGQLSVQPKKGDAILWYNTPPSRFEEINNAIKADSFEGKVVERSLFPSSVHCGQPVEVGTKYFGNFWLSVPKGGFQKKDHTTEAKRNNKKNKKRREKYIDSQMDAVGKILQSSGISGGDSGHLEL